MRKTEKMDSLSKSFCIFAAIKHHTLMLDRAQTIEKLQSSRQYLSEHYGVSSMLLLVQLPETNKRKTATSMYV